MDFLVRKEFTLHSGERGWFKIECDALTDEEIETFAAIIERKVGIFTGVYGIPNGGKRIASALEKYITYGREKRTMLIVDDVWTTGNSMRIINDYHGWGEIEIKKAVMFARKPPDDGTVAVFTMN